MDLPGFQWSTIKRPLATTTPFHNKRIKVDEVADGDFYGYSGQIDYETLQRVKSKTTLAEYMVYADVDPVHFDWIAKILHQNGIHNFDKFLFPEYFNPRDMERWGIELGVGLDLMYHARSFYKAQLNHESHNGGVDLSDDLGSDIFES